MSKIVLIPEPASFDDTPQRSIEQTYEFLTRSTMQGMDVIRQMLNDWVSNYPLEDVSESQSRLRNDFYSCYFEMLILELFIRRSYSLEHHPKLDHTTKRPDFLATLGSDKVFIEAMVLNNQPASHKARENFYNQIYSLLGEFDCGPYLYMIERLIVSGTATPSLKGLKANLIKFVLDHQKLPKCNGEEFDTEKVLSFSYKDEQISLEMGLLPFSEKIEGDRIGSRWDWFWGDLVEPIKKAVLYKGKKYGNQFNAPYVIALNVSGRRPLFTGDVLDALYGSKVEEMNLSTCVQSSYRKQNGILKLLPQVSAVMVGQINLYNLRNAQYSFYGNPFATFPINLGEELPQRIVHGNHESLPGQNIPLNELLKVSEKYQS